MQSRKSRMICYKEEPVMYYCIAETLKPIRPEEIPRWEKIAVILKPEEIGQRKLPPGLLPPDSMLSPGKITGCRLMVE